MADAEIKPVPGDQDRLWAGSMPQAYDRWLAPAMFQPFAVDLARRAAGLAPRRVLEIAAGTALLTRELVSALPAAQVTATDLNAAMVEFGSRQVPRAAWRQADALGLPFDDQEFDLIVCQFGVMFFPDKPAAFREMRRVLAPGGRLLFSTWDAVQTHGFAAAFGLAGHPAPQGGGRRRLGLGSGPPLGELDHAGFHQLEPVEEARDLGMVAKYQRGVDRPLVERPGELGQLRVDARGEMAYRQIAAA